MSLLITRTVVVPIWLLVIAFVAVWTSPAGPVATGLLVLLSGLAVLAIVLLRKPAAHARGAHGLSTIDIWPLSVTAVPRQTRTGRAGLRSEPSARAPFSWPNSGFRNIGRGTKRG